LNWNLTRKEEDVPNLSPNHDRRRPLVSQFQVRVVLGLLIGPNLVAVGVTDWILPFVVQLVLTDFLLIFLLHQERQFVPELAFEYPQQNFPSGSQWKVGAHFQRQRSLEDQLFCRLLWQCQWSWVSVSLTLIFQLASLLLSLHPFPLVFVFFLEFFCRWT